MRGAQQKNNPDIHPDSFGISKSFPMSKTISFRAPLPTISSSTATDTGIKLIVKSGGWRRRLFAFALIGASIVITFLLVTSFYPGENFIDRMGLVYAGVWESTTQRPPVRVTVMAGIMRSQGLSRIMKVNV